MRYLYTALAKYAKQLGDTDGLARWASALAGLDDIALDGDKILLC